MHLAITPRQFFHRTFLLVILLAAPVISSAEPITEFTTIKELKDRSSALEKVSRDEGKWFEPDSNYGRVFLNVHGPQLMLTWLGLLSADYQLADSNSNVTRPVARVFAIYKSNRSETPPVKLTILVPHPRSMSSRKLNLIADFSELQKRVRRAEHHEKITISGFPAELAIDPEKLECRMVVDLPRQSVMYLEVSDCRDGKKLVSFCDAVDIHHLAQKLEK